MPLICVDIAVIVAMCACAYGLGRLFVPRLPVGVIMLVGLGALALLALVLSLVGFTPQSRPMYLEALAAQPLWGGLLAVGGGAGLWAARVDLRHCKRRDWLFGLCGAVSVLAFAALPPSRADETMYHLSLPLQYLQRGGFVVVPGHGNSGFAGFGEMLFLWALGAGSVTAARCVQAVVLASAAQLVVACAPQRSSARLGLALFALTPLCLWQLPCAYVDVMQAAMEVASLAAGLQYARSRQIAWLYAAAFVGGSAAGCKYLGLALLPYSALLLALWARKHAKMLPFAKLLGCHALGWLPYLLRNQVYLDDPVFPFGRHALPAAQLEVLQRFMGQFGPHAGATPYRGWAALWRLPYALLFEADFGSSRFDGVVGLLPLALVAVWLLRRRARDTDVELVAWRIVWASFALYKFSVWLSVSWQARFLMGALLALCLWGVSFWQEIRPGVPAYVTRAVVVITVLLGLRSVWPHTPAPQLDTLRGREARAALRRRAVPASSLCEAVPDSAARVMLVWSQRHSLYCPRPLWSDSYDEAATLFALLDMHDSRDMPRALRGLRVTHLWVDEAALFDMPPVLGDEERARLTKALQRYRVMVEQFATLLAASGSHRLYALTNQLGTQGALDDDGRADVRWSGLEHLSFADIDARLPG